MTFWAYMLRCADGRYYVGHTDSLDRRLAQHEHGGFCDFTARRRPVALIWSETFQTREEALATERRVKGWTRAKKEALCRSDWAGLHELAKSHEARPSTALRTNGKENDSIDPVRAERSRSTCSDGRTSESLASNARKTSPRAGSHPHP